MLRGALCVVPQVIVSATIYVASQADADSKSSALANGILKDAASLETALTTQFASDGVSTATLTVESLTPPTSEADTALEDPCFPGTAMVTLANGTSSRVDALKEGDKIVAATADGSLTTDTLSLLSIAHPEATVDKFITLSTAAGASLTLTPNHHLPVGPACCSTLKMAKDVSIGEVVYTVAEGKATSTTVTGMHVAKATGMHSPVLTNGNFPVVDGFVTSFDSIDKVTLAKHGLASLVSACKMSGTCETLRHLFLGEDRMLI